MQILRVFETALLLWVYASKRLELIKGYSPDILSPCTSVLFMPAEKKCIESREATATKLVTARHLRVSLTDTSNN